MGRAFARPLILPWTWILSSVGSNTYASLLSQQHDYFHVVAGEPPIVGQARFIGEYQEGP